MRLVLSCIRCACFFSVAQIHGGQPETSYAAAERDLNASEEDVPTPQVVLAQPPLHDPNANANANQKPRPHWLHEVNKGLASDVGPRKWISVPHGTREDPETKEASEKLVTFLRRKTNFHDVEGALLWHEVMAPIAKSVVEPRFRRSHDRLDHGLSSSQQSSKVRGLLSRSRSTHTHHCRFAQFKVITHNPV